MTEQFGRYRTIERLGAGGQATAWLVADGDEELLLKTFHVEAADDWKLAELFERSARVLESLDHPQVPRYRDHFELEEGSRIILCLVREFVPGESLAKMVERGKSFDEAEIVDLAQSLLDVLEYLHGLDPPVIHRDIKPANVVMKPDGTPVLVDFGAVQADVVRETGGSTIVGTAGYVSPEQLMGRAQPASDLYALGVTLGELLTGRRPTDLPTDGFELDYSEVLETSRGLGYLIDRMTRADIDVREDSIERLRQQFGRIGRGELVKVGASTLPLHVPGGARYVVEDQGEAIEIRSSRRHWWIDTAALATLFMEGFAIFAMVVVIAAIFEAMYGKIVGFGWIFASIVGFGLAAMGAAFVSSSGFAKLRLEQDGLVIERPGSLLRGEHNSQDAEAKFLYENVPRVEPFKGSDSRWALRVERRGLGPVNFEMGASRGELIWMSRVVNARIEQFRTLNNVDHD